MQAYEKVGWLDHVVDVAKMCIRDRDAAEKMELQKAFGDTEAVALIDLMYNKVGDLQDNIVGMYDALGSGSGVAHKMASAINETEPEKYQRIQQQIHNIKESIGNSLLPTVNELMGKGSEGLAKVGSWIEKNQELVRIIMLVVLAVGGFLAIAEMCIRDSGTEGMGEGVRSGQPGGLQVLCGESSADRSSVRSGGR